jgi:hypothetical protein
VIVSVDVPAGVLGLVVTDNVDVPVAGFGVNEPVAATGNPLML